MTALSGPAREAVRDAIALLQAANTNDVQAVSIVINNTSDLDTTIRALAELSLTFCVAAGLDFDRWVQVAVDDLNKQDAA